MGRFYAIVSLLVACGDNTQLPGSVDTRHPHPGATGSFQPVEREVPEVCGSLQWDGGAIASSPMQVSVAVSPSAFYVVGVPIGGGALQGFWVDTGTKQTGTVGQVPVATGYTSVGIGRVADHLVTAGSDGTVIHVTLLDQNLANPNEIAAVNGTQVVPQAMLLADGTRVVPVGTETSIGLQAFDNTWQVGARRELAPTLQTKGFAASQLGSAILVGWSTPDTCYLATVFTAVGADVSQVKYPCPALRIAGNPRDSTAKVVFEGSDGIYLIDVSASHALEGAQLVRAHATAPRTLWDGLRTWISDLDERGDVVVGFLGPDDQLVSTAVSGTRPDAAAYELAMFDGSPWVFAIEGSYVSATRMCVNTQ
jgi:hypothetical protein